MVEWLGVLSKVALGNKILGEGFDLYFGADDDLDEDLTTTMRRGSLGRGALSSLIS